jgi:hypothetical protein
MRVQEVPFVALLGKNWQRQRLMRFKQPELEL